MLGLAVTNVCPCRQKIKKRLTDEELSLPVERPAVQRDLEVHPALGLHPGHDAGGPVLVHHHPLRVLSVKPLGKREKNVVQ